jgi:xylulokinase
VTYLGIDLGTGSTKAAVVAGDGRVLGRGSATQPVHSPEHGAAETAPAEWMAAARRATQDAMAAAGRPPVDAIGLSGQMHGVVCVDDALEPLRPALLWADVRAREQCRAYDGLAPSDRRPLANPVIPGMFGPLLAWALARDPALRGRLRWALSPKDWLRAALTGEVHTEPSDASATLVWDVEASRWSAAVIDVLDLPSALPPVIASDRVGGRLHREGAALLGLAEGTPVAAGAADVAAALVGSAVPAGQAQLSIGTGAQVVVATDDLVVAQPQVTHRYRRAASHGWYAMAAVQNAGLALEWVRDVLGATWDEMHAALDQVPPGAGGVTFHGYLTGERVPVLAHDVRGAWQGLGLHTRREALLRSALEGVAFALRDAMSALVDEGIPVGDLRLVGGGSADARWRALLAAVLGRTLHVHEVPDVSVVGAARLAAAAVGAALPPATPVDPQMVDPQAAAAVRFDAIWQHWRSRRPVAASP